MPEGTLTEVSVQFYSAPPFVRPGVPLPKMFAMGKDDDTTLSMWIYLGNKTITTLESFGAVEFKPNRFSPRFILGEIDKKVTFSEVSRGVRATLAMQTVGDDNWSFNFTVTFRFSDDSAITMKNDTVEVFDDDETTSKDFDLKPA